VVGDRAARRPLAGGDDGVHGTQHLAFAPVEARGPLRRQPGLVGELQVEEHDEPQPAGVRHDDLRHAARDQSVYHSDRPVRHRAEHVGEHDPRLGRRGWPPAGHRHLLQAEQLAHAAVVGVAPARDRHVVDVGRHDERRHSGRR
jgi:hypothetical protein